ncbi:MAG: lysostaphin resistance A-like protein [Lachnospiraceae bacterium]
MKKTANFFMAFIPLILSLTLQFVLMIPLLGIVIISFSLSGIFTPEYVVTESIMDYLWNVFSSEGFTYALSIAFAASGILIYGFWFRYLKRTSPKTPVSHLLQPKLILGLLLLVPALQIISSLLTSVTAAIFPEWLQFYEEMMEAAGFSETPSIWLILYAVLLGPIEEELTFRGVTMHFSKKALPFWGANLMQAFLFGIFHMNMIQGVYAFFIGIVLGIVYEKTGSLFFSILLHIFFNMWGTLVPVLIPENINNDELTIYIAIASFLLMIIGICLLYIKRPKQTTSQ